MRTTPLPEPTDRIIREIPTIARYSRHNEAEDYRFRTFLKGQLNLSNAALDNVVRETTDVVWSQINCLTCGHCCRSLQIVVDNKDIDRLAARLNQTPRQFKQQYVQTERDKTQVLKSTPCVFLGKDNACQVYEDRPQACRDYPYLYSKDFRSRTFSMVENCATCPIVFNVWQRLKQRFWPRKR